MSILLVLAILAAPFVAVYLVAWACLLLAWLMESGALFAITVGTVVWFIANHCHF